jgi:hypothetical protein
MKFEQGSNNQFIYYILAKLSNLVSQLHIVQEIDRIRLILKDFKKAKEKPKEHLSNVSTGIYAPPSYIVLILMFLIGIPNIGNKSEKISWNVYIEYKGQIFMIRDSVKSGTWSIETVMAKGRSSATHKEIQSKILKASLLLDKVLAMELEQKINEGDFYLNNAYVKLYPIFRFYELRLSESIEMSDSPQKQEGLADMLNMDFKSNKEIGNYCFALMTSFFSLTEFIFEVFYLFEPKSVSLADFNIRKWHEKFKLLFPIEKSTKLKSLYDNFIDIKNNYRNPLTHGLLNRDAYLIPIAGKMIPYSYKNLNKVYHQFFIIEKQEAIHIISVFNQFLTFIESNDPYRYYMYFIKYSFPIPAKSENIDALKQKMTNFEAFKEYIDNQVRYHDFIQ